jgi:hypothetical protein
MLPNPQTLEVKSIATYRSFPGPYQSIGLCFINVSQPLLRIAVYLWISSSLARLLLAI